MNLAIRNILLVTRCARLALWVPILVNIEVLTILISHSFFKGILLGFSLSCVAAYGFLINDIWDVNVDRDNHAGKLEAASRKELQFATILATFFLLFGICLAAMLGIETILIMVAIGLGLTIYTVWARPRLLIANGLAAILASTPIWIPNLVFHQYPNFSQWMIIAISVLLLLGREVIFDVEDIWGDRLAKRRTLPVVLGKQTATRFAVVSQLVACGTLLIYCAIVTSGMPPGLQILLWIALITFFILIVPINLRLLINSPKMETLHKFTVQTRFAMVLLGGILILLIKA